MTTQSPQGHIPLGFVLVGGQRVPLVIDPEWMKYLDSLTTQTNTNTTSTLILKQITGASSMMFADAESSGDSDSMPIFIERGPSLSDTSTVTASAAIAATRGTILVDTTAGDVTITLPAGGIEYTVKRITGGVNVLTVTTTAGTIDDAASLTLDHQYESIDLKSDGTNYWIT